MSTVPYTFANNTGNIPLSQLDANFANVKAAVDYAASANQAVTASNSYTVITPAQGNITSVGTLTSLQVSGTISTAGNVVGNYFIGNGSQLTGIVSTYSNANVAGYLTGYTGNIACDILGASGDIVGANITGGNLLTGGLVSATANVTGGNILTVGYVSATGNLTTAGALNGATLSLSGNVTSTLNVTGNVNSSNILTAGLVSATGNATSGNVLTAGQVSATGNVTGGNILTGGYVSATGNISSFNLVAPNDGGIDSGPTTVYSAGSITFPTLVSGAQIRIGYLPAYGDGIAVSTSNLLAGTSYLTNQELITGNVTAEENLVVNFNLDILNGNISIAGLEVITYPNYIEVTSSNTYSLSSTSSTNLLRANNTGYTATINMPSSPVNGQICKFTVAGNAITLAAGTGNVSPSFAGGRSPGVGFKYIYNIFTDSWYQTV